MATQVTIRNSINRTSNSNKVKGEASNILLKPKLKNSSYLPNSPFFSRFLGPMGTVITENGPRSGGICPWEPLLYICCTRCFTGEHSTGEWHLPRAQGYACQVDEVTHAGRRDE